MDQFVKELKISSYHPFVRLSISVLTAEVVLSEVSHSLPVKQPKNTHRAQNWVIKIINGYTVKSYLM